MPVELAACQVAMAAAAIRRESYERLIGEGRAKKVVMTTYHGFDKT